MDLKATSHNQLTQTSSFVLLPFFSQDRSLNNQFLNEEKSDFKEEKENEDDGRKTSPTAIRLAYNKLSSVSGLISGLNLSPESVERVEWLDLSYNSLSDIEDDLLKFKGLKSLTLNCNSLSSFVSISRLSSLSNLRKLTLFGNEKLIEKDFYRFYIIDAIPQLKSLDSNVITVEDRNLAVTFKPRFAKYK